jgi:C4-dicarboxylate transporter/malic acid transport protein
MSTSKPSLLRSFAPGWFASVMGTAVSTVAVFVFRDRIPFSTFLQLFFLAVSIIMFAILIVPWTLRWFLHFDAVRADLRNPVSAAFFPTMPISLLVIGIALEKTGHLFLSEQVLWNTLQGLWLVGSGGILIFAFVILSAFFHHDELKWESASLGWLIPPVSALLVPVLGGSLAMQFAGTTWSAIDLIGSIVFLGIGGILFIFVMTVVFARYIFHPLPPAHLSPTLWVGIAPTAILTILAIKLVKPLVAFFQAAPEVNAVLTFLSLPTAVALWGFALFWLLLAFFVTLKVHQKSPLPFALSWWAFVFPVGAFTVASGVLYQAVQMGFFLWVGLSALAGLIGLWLVVAVRTLHGIWLGSIFHHPPAKP